ncbi:hypothetical protein GCM10023201_28910 [Actinomycetospora corticicola]|uniref:Uncharacterized protein n=1 Tax=Actinomycetospora corticicola TaxID=663602 RepID=A0A7Y9DXG3_9PSEU|nr:hypothetical protein [Actinomycetospora corticicola]
MDRLADRKPPAGPAVGKPPAEVHTRQGQQPRNLPHVNLVDRPLDPPPARCTSGRASGPGTCPM